MRTMNNFYNTYYREGENAKVSEASKIQIDDLMNAFDSKTARFVLMFF